VTRSVTLRYFTPPFPCAQGNRGLEEYEDSEIVPVIEKEIAELQSRMKR